MIKRYTIGIEYTPEDLYSDVGADLDIQEYEKGEWVKYDDVKDLIEEYGDTMDEEND